MLILESLRHIEKAKTIPYNLQPHEKYDSNAINLHKLVNELFEPCEQVDEIVSSTIASTMSTSSRNTNGGVRRNAVRDLKPGSASVELFDGVGKDKPITLKFIY